VNNDNNSILIGSWGEQFPADEFFELTFYNDDTGVMTVYYNEGKKKSPSYVFKMEPYIKDLFYSTVLSKNKGLSDSIE
jgi:hypothetical protein